MPNVYQIVTERFIAALKEGTIPWRKPWSAQGADQWPINRKSGKPYRGVNVWLLALEASARGYESNEWLTYKQAQELGGQVRKKERSTLVTFWKVNKYIKEGEDKERKGLLLRYYNVFNVAQCDGIEPRRAVERSGTVQPFQAIEAAEELCDGWSVPVQHRGSQASYSPLLDIITMPKPSAFVSPEAYYATRFHEMIHSTGHDSRLARGLTGYNQNSDSYSKEELVAEIGASFLCHKVGIETSATIENSKAYVQHWISELTKDEKLIMSASSAAQKAVDLIEGKVFEEVTQEEGEDEPILAAA